MLTLMWCGREKEGEWVPIIHMFHPVSEPSGPNHASCHGIYIQYGPDSLTGEKSEGKKHLP